MASIEKLYKVVSETTCTLFSLNITPSLQWKMYIFQSKKVIIGTLDQVCAEAIAEFVKNRISITPKKSKHRNMNDLAKFKYIAGKLYTPIVKVVPSSAYSRKLEFAKSLGFANVTQAVGKLSAFEFNNQFKNYKTG